MVSLKYNYFLAYTTFLTYCTIETLKTSPTSLYSSHFFGWSKEVKGVFSLSLIRTTDLPNEEDG